METVEEINNTAELDLSFWIEMVLECCMLD